VTREVKEYQVPVGGKHFLSVVEAGQGPPVLLVHGGAGSWTNFTHQIKDLSQTHRVVAPNLRGHGKSPWPGPSDIDDFYGDLTTLIGSLDLPHTFHLVGHSFGGYLSARFAAEFPERVSSLALLNTAGDLPQGFAYRFLETFSGGADLVRHYYPWMVSTGSEVARCLMRRTLKQWDCWDLYPRIQAPTLVVLGGRDPLIPLRKGREMASRIPQARLEVLPTGGHVSMAENPEVITLWLLQHMEQALSASRSA
jgi:pimeloyl-ACP methyl ester carboxylesterase